MTDRTPSLSQLERTREEVVRAQWTQWRSFLLASIALVEARMTTDRPAHPFEADPHGQAAQEEAAHAQLAALDHQRRALFEQVYEQARQAAQAEAEQRRAALPAAERAKPLDPDTIDRQVLQTLLDDAEGRGRSAPRGRVPIEPGTWWVVEAQAFLAAPKLEAYTIAGQRRRGSKVGAYGGIAAMLVLGVGALLAYFFWPSGQTVAAVAGQPVLAASTPVPTWPLRSIQLRGSDIPSTTLPLDPQHTTGCAGLMGEGPAAGVTPGFALPLSICVRGIDLGRIDEVVVFAHGDQPARRYSRTSVPVPDLSLSAAGGVGWFGALRETPPQVDYAVGEAAALDDETTVHVVAVRGAGPAEDPTLPTDQMRVTVVVSATADALDWPVLVPTLLSARGDVLETSATARLADSTELSYVLPIVTEATDVVWRVSRSDGSVIRWRATLPPPRDRTALLRTSLQLGAVRAVVAPDDPSAVELELEVRNNGAVPLVLQAADLQVTNEGQPMVVAAIEGIVEPIDPGGTRTLTTQLQAAPNTTLILSLADQRRAVHR